MSRNPAATLAALLLTLAAARAAPAQTPQAPLPKQPPPPAKFRVLLRYDIPAPRDPHVALYDAMVEHLEKLGFEFDPPLAKRPETDREDRSRNRMEGFIAPANALRILESTSIASMVLIPDELKLADAPPEQPVWVRLQLASGLSTDRQRELSEQARALLALQDFREAVAYDTRGYTGQPFTRLVGTVPLGRLDTLLKDLRDQPGGWIAPVIPRMELPLPLRSVNPVRVVEVLRETEPLKESRPPEPRGPDYLEKISDELWELVKQPDAAAQRVRVQVIFVGDLADDDQAWRQGLADAVPGFFIEGHLGNYVTGTVLAGQIKTLASLQGVSTVRLPRLTRVDADPALKLPGDNAKVLARSGVAALHKRGARGQKVRLGIIDTDFRLWQERVKAGKLPKGTRLVDLTAERDPGLVPSPYPGDPAQPGHGTLCAEAAAMAAPEAEIVLIRTDAIAPYQLREIVRYVQGGRYSPNIEERRDDVAVARAFLQKQRETLLRERQRVLDNFNDEGDLQARYGLLGPAYGWLFSERAWHYDRMRYFEKEQEDLRRREVRLDDFLRTVDSLRGIAILSCPLLWSDGFPLGGLSPLSRWLDADPAGRPLWVQSAGNKRGQAWLGDFHSLAGQAALDFAPGQPPAKGRWTNELNFLAWQPYRAASQPELPEKARLRLTLQWREPHDPDYFLRPGEPDYYRIPLAALRLVLLRQRDPEAKAVPADLFEVVARTEGRPQRLEHEPAGTIYEIVLDVTLEKAGRYAVRVERRTDTAWEVPDPKAPRLVRRENRNPIGIRPLGVPVLPAMAREWELRPRLFVETTDDMPRLQGRAVLGDFWTDGGTVGVAADARGVVSVGAADLDGKPRPDSTTGNLPFIELSSRPTLLAYDALQLDGGTAFGTSVATAYTAGTAAALLSAGATREQVRAWLHARDGKVLQVPALK